MALEDAWSILKRQKPRPKHAVPQNPFNTRRNQIIRLQRALDSKPVVATRGNAGFHNKRRAMLRRQLEQLQQEEEAEPPMEEELPEEPVEEDPPRIKWLDDPSQTKYFAQDETGNPRMRTGRERMQQEREARLAPLFGSDGE